MTRRNALALGASVLMLSACITAGPDYESPDLAAYEAQPIADETVDTLASDPAAEWWRLLEDDTLNGFVETAFRENRHLQEAAANVSAVRARLRHERTGRRPTGEVTADYQQQRPAGALEGSEEPLDDEDYAAIGFSAGWELDFSAGLSAVWRRQRRMPPRRRLSSTTRRP